MANEEGMLMNHSREGHMTSELLGITGTYQTPLPHPLENQRLPSSRNVGVS